MDVPDEVALFLLTVLLIVAFAILIFACCALYGIYTIYNYVPSLKFFIVIVLPLFYLLQGTGIQFLILCGVATMIYDLVAFIIRTIASVFKKTRTPQPKRKQTGSSQALKPSYIGKEAAYRISAVEQEYPGWKQVRVGHKRSRSLEYFHGYNDALRRTHNEGEERRSACYDEIMRLIDEHIAN